MKLFTVLAVAATVTLGACDTGGDVQPTGSPTIISTVADPLIGKRLVSGDNSIILNAGGTVGGALGGETIVGTYQADEEEICSTYSAPELLTGKEFCSVPVISGDTVIFNRRDGSQSPTYTIQG